MPYKIEPIGSAQFQMVKLWAHRSLPMRGFVWTIWLTFIFISLPLFMVLGTIVFWGLLPFLMITVGALWLALQRNYKDRNIQETLRSTDDMLTLERRNPKGDTQTWECNPYWARTNMYVNGGPVKNYVTLSGNGREVEIGSFLTEEERLDLFRDLNEYLSNFKSSRLL